MVEDQNNLLDDDLLLETLDNLPRISVPGVMLPKIMDQVLDEHIRVQFRTFLIPLYLGMILIVFGLVSILSPSDLKFPEFFNLVFSAPDCGVLLYYHQLVHISSQMVVLEPLRDHFLSGMPLFILIIIIMTGLFIGLRLWIKWMHRSSQERSPQ